MKTLFRARHARQKERLKRRIFLSALGVGLSAPLAVKMSRLATAQSTERPTRLFIHYLANGLDPEHYNFTSALEPHASYQSLITTFEGLGISGVRDHPAIPHVMTGDGQSDSIDYIVANALGVEAHVMGIDVNDNSATAKNLAKHGGWVSPMSSAQDAAERMFSALGGDTPDPEEVDESVFRQETLALTEAEVETLRDDLAGLTSEQNKLKAHLDALSSLTTVITSEPTLSCDGRPPLPIVDGGGSGITATLDGFLEASAQAFICGSARVATLQNLAAGGNLRMDFAGGPGIPKNHHEPLSHSGPWDPAGREEFGQCQKWFHSHFAEHFLQVLADTNDPLDPEHTVLENSTIVSCTEVGDGQLHNSAPENGSGGLPWLIIGGGSGYFKPGQNVGERMDHRDFWAAVAASMGVSLTNFGGASVTPPGVLIA